MPHLGLWLTVLVLGVVLSFFLSGMESGVFAMSRVRIRHWMQQGRPGAGQLNRFLQHPEDFLWTILVGNTLANVTVVALVVLLLHAYWGHRPGWVLAGLGAGVFVFHALADLLPKLLFQSFPNRLCLLGVRPFRLIHLALSPLVRVLRWASGLVTPRAEPDGMGGLSGSREELRLTLQDQQAELTSEERSMIGRVLELNAVKVGQLAKPLERAATVMADTSLAEVMELCRRRHLTRLPVWERVAGQRRVAGVISLKTLLYQKELDPRRPAADFLKPALFLSEEARLEEALRRMQRGGQRLGIVLGRERQEVGLISLEDILRFMFGEVTV